MKIVFISNYFNHHQKPLSDALDKLTEHNYCFIATKPFNVARRNLGYSDINHKYDYVLCAYEDEAKLKLAQKLINEADVAIIGSALFKLVQWRLDNGKLTFCYSERIYKNGYEWYKMPVRTIKNYFRYGKYRNLYMLCASAYTAADYAKTLSFINKTYKWGYFTEVIKYDIDKLITAKKHNSLLWVGRFIELKHPELPIMAAKKLRDDGYKFELNIIGSGHMQTNMELMIKNYNLGDCVHILGSMPHQEVRSYMEKSEIFMFTSDRNEGWGAVLNEAMNSGCAVVASHIIGSVPFLIQNNENGLIYNNGSFDELYSKLCSLFDNSEFRVNISKKAYLTIIEQWNPGNAAERLIEISRRLANSTNIDKYDSGVCSKAEIISEKWYSVKKGI